MGIGGIFVYTQFGDVLRHQTAAGASAVTASAGASRSVGNFAGSGAYDGGSPEGEDANPDGLPPPGAGGVMADGTESVIAENQAKYKEGTDPLRYKEVQNVIKLSPTLKADIAKLKTEGWDFRFIADIGSHVDFNRRIVRISNRGNEIGAVQRLAHEIGHAINGDHYDYSSKEAHVQSRLEDEGAAVMKNIQVQREILKKGRDIGVNCSISPCSGKDGRYTAIYDQYVIDRNVTAARKAIAEKRAVEAAGILANRRIVTYREYYEASWYFHVRRQRSSPQPQRSQAKTPVTF